MTFKEARGSAQTEDGTSSAPVVQIATAKRAAHKRVALVGFWPVTRDQAYTDPYWADAEHWSLNHNFPYLKGGPDSWNVWMDIHDPQWTAGGGLLKEVAEDLDRFLRKSHGKPIYMQRHYPEYPDSVAYPLEAIIAKFGRSYFTAAVSFMVALALYEGVEELGIFGADMRNNEEYSSQRPCFEYWLGRAEAMGVKVYVPPESGILHAPDGLYGYNEEGSAWIELQRAHENRIAEAKGLRDAAYVKAAAAQGKRDLLQGLIDATSKQEGTEELVKAYTELYAKADDELAEALSHRYAFEGVVQENEDWLRKITERRRGGGVIL